MGEIGDKRLLNDSNFQFESCGGERNNIRPQKCASDTNPNDVLSRTGRRIISRRGSFVAGSKIEHFDGYGRRGPRTLQSRATEVLGEPSLDYDRSERRNRSAVSRGKEVLGETCLDNDKSRRRGRTCFTRRKDGLTFSSPDIGRSRRRYRTSSARSTEGLGDLSLD